MPEHEFSSTVSAIQDFRRARRRAAIEALFARLRGQSSELLSYEDVRQKLRANSRREKGFEDIPLDAIIGSVGRYTDFTRGFFPLQDSDAHRWARVKAAITSLEGVPPIDVYQIGDAYFVRDGNHRVSVARELGATHIHAHVTEVQTAVPLSPTDSPDDVILKAEYTDFLAWSELRAALPGADLMVTAPGRYEDLREHISVHRYFMGLEQKREIGIREAVAHWYEHVYLPVVRAINNLGILRDFPERTETDLYLWTLEHRATLEKTLGWTIDPEDAAESLAARYSPKAARVLTRLSDRLLNTLLPENLAISPPPGEWRRKEESRQRNQSDTLFHDILVSIDGKAQGWQTLDQAIELARRERGRLLGLHITPAAGYEGTQSALELELEFERRCQVAGVTGKLAFGNGPIAHEITARARWADLIVAPLNYPPAADPIGKLRSGFRTMILRSPIPILAVPETLFPVERALLAYDGSPRSETALFMATVLATRWSDLALIVLTVSPDPDTAEKHLAEARTYLVDHGVNATYLQCTERKASKSLLAIAREHAVGLILMGGYGRNALLEVFLGSTVNDVLRRREYPVLICP